MPFGIMIDVSLIV